MEVSVHKDKIIRKYCFCLKALVIYYSCKNDYYMEINGLKIIVHDLLIHGDCGWLFLTVIIDNVRSYAYLVNT